MKQKSTEIQAKRGIYTYRENTYGEATAKQLEPVIALRFWRALLLKSTISVKLPKLLGIGTL